MAQFYSLEPALPPLITYFENKATLRPTRMGLCCCRGCLRSMAAVNAAHGKVEPLPVHAQAFADSIDLKQS
eukprot:1158396-Pelagomonas_calceolata.AAC.6